jgi:hypothetical protein
VNLVLLADRPVAAEQVGDVVEVLVLQGEVRAADDVDVVLDRQVGEEVEVLRRVLGELAGGLGRVRPGSISERSCVVNSSGNTTKSLR